MSVLNIVTVPDPRLKQKAEVIPSVDDRIRRLMDDMLETMYQAPGVGLAAPQVGVLERVIVLDVADRNEKPQPFAMANPEILWVSEERNPYTEGCLSIPDQYAEVIRPSKIKVGWHDREGKRQEMEADGLLGRCIQHEIDHLNGILFIDHLSSLKRTMLMRKYDKAQRMAKKVKASDVL